MNNTSEEDLKEKLNIKVDGAADADSIDSEETEPEPPLPSIDGYDIEALIGKGGMGYVYRVVERSTGQKFAIKVLNAELSQDKVARQRFKQEVDSASQIDHEHIAAVYRHGVTNDGAPYMVMEHLEGENLSQVLKKHGSLEPNRLIDLLLQVGDAVSHAHKAGVIHRDVKPTNIIISSPGSDEEQAKIVDFGIAKVQSNTHRETVGFTETGDIFGSPDYMSPEQCLGFQLDAKSDIYSFGCVLYQLLSGETPFKGANPIQVVVKQINEPAPALPEQVERTSTVKHLESVISRCLEKEPGSRYESMDELLNDLRLIREGKPIPEYKHLEKPKPTLTGAQAFGITFFGMIGIMLLSMVLPDWLKDYNFSPSLWFQVIAGLVLGLGAHLFSNQLVATIRQVLRGDCANQRYWVTAFKSTAFGLLSILSLICFVSFFVSICVSEWPKWANQAMAFPMLAALLCLYLTAISGAGCLFFRTVKKVSRSRFVTQFLATGAVMILTATLVYPNSIAVFPYAVAGTVKSISTSSAEQLLRIAHAISPTLLQPLNDLQTIAKESKDKEKSIEFANEYIKLFPDNANYYQSRADIWKDYGETAKALADNEKALSLQPKWGWLYKWRGQTLLMSGDTMKAIDQFKKAISLEPEGALYYRLLGAAYARMGDYAHALEQLDAAILTRNGHSAETYLEKARIERRLGNIGQSIKDLNMAVRLAENGIRADSSDKEELQLVKAYSLKLLGRTGDYDSMRRKIAKDKIGLDKLDELLNTKYSNLKLNW